MQRETRRALLTGAGFVLTGVALAQAQVPPAGPARVTSPGVTTPAAGTLRRVTDSPTFPRAELMRQAFPAMRGLGQPVVVSMRSPNVGNVYLSSLADAASFSAGPFNSRPGAAAEGELTLRMGRMGAALSVHIRAPTNVAYAVEFEGDTGDWSPEYEIGRVDSAGRLIGSAGVRGYASMVGRDQWLISVPAAPGTGVVESVVSIRAPWDANDLPRANLRFRRATVTPISQ